MTSVGKILRTKCLSFCYQRYIDCRSCPLIYPNLILSCLLRKKIQNMSEGTCLGVIPLKAGVLGIAAVQVIIINISHISYFYLKKR